MIAATGNSLNNVIQAGETGARLNGAGGNDILIGGNGADIFEIAAGNGSDVIYNFKPGWDVINLEGYHFGSFDQVQALARQSGDDVIFTLGNEKLVVKDVNLDDLHSYDLGFAMDKAPIEAGQTYMEGAGRAQNWNGWYVHNNTWGTDALQYGKDFTADATFNPEDATAGTTFTWTMPYSTVIGSPVLAYPEVAFGVSPMGANENNPGDTAAVFPVQVGDLVALKADYDVDFSGNVSGFNVAYDIWFSNEPNGGRDTMSNEVMVWVHKGGMEVYRPVVGTYQDGDVTYTIYHEGTYTALVADRDVPANDLDLLAMFDVLKDLGIMKDSEYLASVELGAEVKSGTGSLTINNLDLSVASKGEDGAIIVKEVTGSGQTVTEVSADDGVPQPTDEASPPTQENTPPADETAASVDDAPPTLSESSPSVEEALPPAQAIKQPAAVLEAYYKDVSSQAVSSGGLVLGKTQAHLEGDYVRQDFYSGKGTLLSFDKVVIEDSGNIARQHFSVKGVFAGAEVANIEANGSVNTFYYDAFWQFSGAENTLVKDNGATQILHYNSSYKLTGVDVVSEDAHGRISTLHYDGSWKYLGQDVQLPESNGEISIQHYGANNKFTGQDTTLFHSDGSIATYHYSESWQKTGFDVSRVGNDGVVKTLVRDADSHLLSTDWTGTTGNDTIKASSGTNILIGGLGSDNLHGHDGVDFFVLDTAIGRGDIDSIFDFTSGEDMLVLDQAVFNALPLGSLSDSAFGTGGGAHDANDRLVYDQASGSLSYDADGNGAGKAVEIARFEPGTTVRAGDIVVATNGTAPVAQAWDVHPGEWHNTLMDMHVLSLTIA